MTFNAAVNYDSQPLKWRFDVNTFRLLGRELITDRVTAIFELAKNSYDADSKKVVINFSGVSSNSGEKKITISDDGIGMSFEDIRDKWMVVGTNSKRVKTYSDPPFNRKFVGEKGIGRFAVEKLAETLLIRTKKKGEKKWLNVTIDWTDYERKSSNPASENGFVLFTEIENEYFYEDGDESDHGTALILSGVRDIWTDKDLERTYKELSKFLSPFHPFVPPFDIYIESNEFQDYSHKRVESDPIRFYSHFGEIKGDVEANRQQRLRFDRKTGKIVAEWIEIRSFGSISMKIYYFNEAAKKRFNAFYRNDETRIDGVKIYRDGLITTPFAEYESDVNKKRDILGIDKRRWRAAFDKVGTREIIGVVEITKKYNSRIIDATNRQDFLDNAEYRRLKEFIIEQVDVFSEVKEYERQAKRSLVERKFYEAGQEVRKFEAKLSELQKKASVDRPELAVGFNSLKLQADALSSTIAQSLDEQKKFQKDVARKESIYLSLMSLQDYAANISHAVRTSLGKIRRMADFFKHNFPDPKHDRHFKKYSRLIGEEMNTLVKVTDFMLSYAGANADFEDFSVKQMLEDLFLEEYDRVFIDENIRVIVEIKDDFFLSTNKKFFQDVFQNLVSNSVKALRNIENKIIKCSGFLDADNFTLYFSDNGGGVEKGDEEWIFELYNTRTADQGGAGLGLYIVEKRIQALKGKVELTESEFKPTGATFKITLPFAK